MTPIQYRPVRQYLSSPDLGRYVTYGICALAVTPGGQVPVELISDVSSCMAVVERLARACTRLGLDPVHLRDVVEDALGL